MNPTDTCPDCMTTQPYDGVTGDFDLHEDAPGQTCPGSGTPAPATVGTGTVSNQPLIAAMQGQGIPQGLQNLFGGQGLPGFAPPTPTEFQPPVRKPKRPTKVEQLAKALMSDVMAPAPTPLEPPKPGQACTKHGLAAQTGVACGFCQMEYEQQQPVEFKADHATNQPKHMDGSPCTQTDQCPWSFTSWNALNTRLGQRELDEVVARLSGSQENLDSGPKTYTMQVTPQAQQAMASASEQSVLAQIGQRLSSITGQNIEASVDSDGDVVIEEVQTPVQNNTGLPDDVARSLGLI